MLRAFQFALVVLMLAALAMISAVVTMHFAIHGAEVKVPSFKGLTVTEAADKAAALGLHLNVANHFYSVDISPGRILSQSPTAGTVVRREWHVQLIESLGPQRVAIPKLSGLDQRVASIQIQRAGLELGATAQMPWAYAPVGAVIAQDPAPGAAGVARPTVSLLIAAPPEASSNAFVMPDLTGQLFSAASAAVAQAGLKMAPPLTAPMAVAAVAGAASAQPLQPMIPSGSVVAQSPAAGTRVDASTSVQLTVAQ